MGSKVTCVGLGNAYTRPLGYIVIWVQVDGVQGYNEDQIVLVFRSFQFHGLRISHPGNAHYWQSSYVMKEAEMDALAMLWANARVVHLYQCVG